MYETFFGLTEKPFSLTPDPRYFYLSESHREGLARLIYGVREKAGLITLTGPVGVGKTMILAAFLAEVREHSETVFFSGGVSANRTRFLKDLCGGFGLSTAQDTLLSLSQAIRDFAVKETGKGRSVVVVVDEAQDLGPEELDHFHHLSNLETTEAKLLQIVLAGTERLGETLRERNLEALWQRVAIRCVIRPIEPEETIEYIFHRARIAGSSSSEFFTDAALWRIVNYTRGLPRLINQVCNHAMIAAYASGRVPVDEDAVLEAVKEIGASPSGIEKEEVVGREEIRGLVERVSRRVGRMEEPLEREKGSAQEEAQACPLTAEVEEFEGVFASGRQPGFFSRIRTEPRRRLAFTLGLVLLLSFGGVLIAMGWLRPADTGLNRVVVALPQESTHPSEGGPAGQPALGYPTRGSGQERILEEKAGADIKPELPGPGSPVVQETREASSGGLDERAAKVPLEGGDSMVPVRETGKKMTARGRDLAAIALEHYGRLDIRMLKTIREENPQIADWNRLDRAVEIMLPDMPRDAKGGADFYTIQVGAFRSEAGAAKRASDLARRGAQNLFLVKRDAKDQDLTLVCAGLFESGPQSSGGVSRMREWGYEDAFPTRIQGKRLEDIVRPYQGLAQE